MRQIKKHIKSNKIYLFTGLCLIFSLLLSNNVFSQPTELDSLKLQIVKLEKNIQQLSTSLIRVEERSAALKWSVNLFFWILAAIVSITTISQRFSDWTRKRASEKENSRYRQMVTEQQEKHDEYRRNQEEKWQGLLDTVKSNVKSTTDFIGSLDQMFKLQGKAEELDVKYRQLIEAEEKRGKEAEIQRGHQLSQKKKIAKGINAKGIRISSLVSRKNYSTKFNIGQYNELASQANPVLALADKEQRELINGDVYLLLGISLRIEGQYKDAIKRLDTAIEKGKLKINHGIKEILFPEKNIIDEVGGYQAWNERIIGHALYQKGLIAFRQGKYQNAAKIFEEAYKFDSTDMEALFLHAESRYWGQNTSFDDVVIGFSNIENKISSSNISDILLAQLYNCLGNIYFPSKEKGAPFPSKKDLKLAGEMFNKANSHLDAAMEKGQQSSYNKLATILFSNAQVSELISQSNLELRNRFEDKAKSLYEQTINLANKQLHETDDNYTHYILNYIISVSNEKVGLIKEARIFLNDANDDLRDFATMPNYQIYSPVSKRMLSYTELKKEMG